MATKLRWTPAFSNRALAPSPVNVDLGKLFPRKNKICFPDLQPLFLVEVHTIGEIVNSETRWLPWQPPYCWAWRLGRALKKHDSRTLSICHVSKGLGTSAQWPEGGGREGGGREEHQRARRRGPHAFWASPEGHVSLSSETLYDCALFLLHLLNVKIWTDWMAKALNMADFGKCRKSLQTPRDASYMLANGFPTAYGTFYVEF